MMVCLMQLTCIQLQYWLSYWRCTVCDFWQANFTNKLTRHVSITKLFCEHQQERVKLCTSCAWLINLSYIHSMEKCVLYIHRNQNGTTPNIKVEGDEAEIACTPLSLASMSKWVAHVQLKIATEIGPFLHNQCFLKMRGKKGNIPA